MHDRPFVERRLVRRTSIRLATYLYQHLCGKKTKGQTVVSHAVDLKGPNHKSCMS